MTGRMEKRGKPGTGFPRFSHRALGNRCRDSHIPTAPVTVSLFSKPKRKEPLATDLHLFRSGSFFDEKMLRTTPAAAFAEERSKRKPPVRRSKWRAGGW